MAQDFSARNSPDRPDDDSPYDEYDPEFDDAGPSLPIILISTTCGIGGSVIGLYLSYIVLGWEIQPSVFVAVLSLSLSLGIAGAGLSALTGSRATLANIGFSCGLILVTVLFFGLCTLVGALAATLLLVRS